MAALLFSDALPAALCATAFTDGCDAGRRADLAGRVVAALNAHRRFVAATLPEAFGPAAVGWRAPGDQAEFFTQDEDRSRFELEMDEGRWDAVVIAALSIDGARRAAELVADSGFGNARFAFGVGAALVLPAPSSLRVETAHDGVLWFRAPLSCRVRGAERRRILYDIAAAEDFVSGVAAASSPAARRLRRLRGSLERQWRS